MSEELCAKLERDIRNYEAAAKYLKDVYLESLGKDNPEPSLEQLVDTGVYIQGRISAMKSNLQMSKKVEADFH